MKKYNFVVVSGYFNPIHKGHIEMLKSAKDLGEKVIVILNNDEQVRLKGSYPFMSEIDRRSMMESIRYVDSVVVSVDQDKTVKKTLELIRVQYAGSMVFANGGDRKNEEDIPEAEICKVMAIDMIFGVGGEKIESSSRLIKQIQENK